MSATTSGQHWTNCDGDIRSFLLRLTSACRKRIGANFRASYLHGSLAMGSFRRATSDLDILLVMEGRLQPGLRADLSALLLELSDQRPLRGDIEVSIVQAFHLKPFVHPTPYEFHYSASVRRAIASGTWDTSDERLDRDLAAHGQVLRARGIVLAGPPIETVIGSVPRDAYVDALLYDLASILDGSSLADSPVYGILNCCRVLAVLGGGRLNVMNKEEGGVWGLAHLPRRHRILVGQALECQRGRWQISPEHVKTGGLRWNPNDVSAFRDYVACEVGRLMGSRIAG
jgi:streptomycin 3"-adenylyltransferase